MKIAVIFLTTKKNHFNLQILKKQAKKSSLHQIDIYEYVENDNYKYEVNDKTILFSLYYLGDKYNWHHTYCNGASSLGSKTGLEFLPLIDTYNNYKDKYDMYLFYEDDTSYFGEKNLFDSIDFNCDAIFQDKRLLVETDHWVWWEKFPHSCDRNIIKILYHGLLNIYALSPNIIKNFIEFIKTNYAEHELLISAYVLNNNYYTVHYVDDYIKSWFHWSDIAPINNEYNLIHPIKTLDKYILINKKHLSFTKDKRFYDKKTWEPIILIDDNVTIKYNDNIIHNFCLYKMNYDNENNIYFVSSKEDFENNFVRV